MKKELHTWEGDKNCKKKIKRRAGFFGKIKNI
jgi:hypothetical protein